MFSRAVLFLAGVIALPISAVASQTNIQSVVDLGMQTDNNFSLASRYKRDVHTARTGVSARVLNESDRSRFSLDNTARFQRYFGEYDASRDVSSYRSIFDGLSRLSERSTLNTRLSYDRSKTSSDEYFDSEFQVFLRERDVDKVRNIYQVSLGFEHQLDERKQISAQFDGSKNDYDDAANTQLLDYRYDSLAMQFTGVLNEAISGYLNLSVARYRPDASDQSIQRLNAVKSDSLSAVLGLRMNMSELSMLDFSSGWRTVDYDPLIGRDSEDQGYSGSLSYTYQHERLKYLLEASETLQPSSNGTVRSRTNVQSSIKWKASEQVDLSLSARYEKEQDRAEQGTEQDEYFQFQASLFHRTSARQSIRLEVRQRQALTGDRAKNVTGLVSWTYRPDALFL